MKNLYRSLLALLTISLAAVVFVTAASAAGPPGSGITLTCAATGQSTYSGFKGNPSIVNFEWTVEKGTIDPTTGYAVEESTIVRKTADMGGSNKVYSVATPLVEVTVYNTISRQFENAFLPATDFSSLTQYGNSTSYADATTCS